MLGKRLLALCHLADLPLPKLLDAHRAEGLRITCEAGDAPPARRHPAGSLLPSAAHGAAPPKDTPCLGGAPFTFGSFNGLGKMNDRLLSAWIEILQRAPASRLRMGHVDSDTFTRELRARMERAGMDPARLDVLPKLPMGE